MRKNKLTVILAITVLSLVFLFPTLPRANAFHSGSISVVPTGVARFSDPLLGTVDSARDGTTVTFDVKIIADTTVGERNITVGAKFDWMSNYVNASTTTLTLTAGQYATVTVSIALPTLTGAYTGLNLYSHTWEVKVWSDIANTPITSSSMIGTTGIPVDCNHLSGSLDGCIRVQSSTNFAIYRGDQADGMVARNEASSKASSLSILLGSLQELPAGASKAASDLSQASAELNLGDQSYRNGDFGGATTHYRTALNYANSAMGALSGSDTASFTNTLMNGVGWLLIGVGVILAGFGAFFFLRKRAKA